MHKGIDTCCYNHSLISLEFRVSGMHSDPRVNEQNKVLNKRFYKCSWLLWFGHVCIFILQVNCLNGFVPVTASSQPFSNNQHFTQCERVSVSIADFYIMFCEE